MCNPPCINHESRVMPFDDHLALMLSLRGPCAPTLLDEDRMVQMVLGDMARFGYHAVALAAAVRRMREEHRRALQCAARFVRLADVDPMILAQLSAPV